MKEFSEGKTDRLNIDDVYSFYQDFRGFSKRISLSLMKIGMLLILFYIIGIIIIVVNRQYQLMVGTSVQETIPISFIQRMAIAGFPLVILGTLIAIEPLFYYYNILKTYKFRILYILQDIYERFLMFYLMPEESLRESYRYQLNMTYRAILFFNNQTEWNTPFDFRKDFCLKRKVEVKKRIKSKQFIRVKVHFVRGKRYEKSLPEKFWVSRTWYRDSGVPVEKNSLRPSNIKAQSLHRAQASLQRYLNTIRFEYVPAVKDRSYFTYSLGRLQDAILEARDTGDVKKIIENLNAEVHNEAIALSNEFEDVAGIKTSIDLPEDLTILFRAFSVSTGEGEIPLGRRGDGIQARFLPSLLHHIASRSKKVYIWGFEEPENCVHPHLFETLMDLCRKSPVQVVITTHSPYLVDQVSPEDLRLVIKEEGKTKISHVKDIEKIRRLLEEGIWLGEAWFSELIE